MNSQPETLPKDYHLCCHAELGGLAAQTHELASLTFGSYPGVLRPSAVHRDWYLRRPGMDPRLSMAAVCRDQLVGNAFVTVQQVRLGGELRPVGIVDTVMTHPEHRRRGLARRVLGQAIRGMQERGLFASLLYTLAGSMPYRFYQQLGYRPHVVVHSSSRVQGATAPPSLTLRRATVDDGPSLMACLNDHYHSYDGYVPLNDELWRWRKLDRPDELPAETWFVTKQERILGCVTICRGPIISASGAAFSYVLTDLATSPQTDPRQTLTALLSPVPEGAPMRILLPQVNRPINALLASAGFREDIGEVSMVLPLDPGAGRALTRPPKRWYALTESVIGV